MLKMQLEILEWFISENSFGDKLVQLSGQMGPVSSRLLRVLLGQDLNIFRGGDSTSPLGNLLWYLTTHTVNNIILNTYFELLLLTSVASWPFTVHFQQDFALGFCTIMVGNWRQLSMCLAFFANSLSTCALVGPFLQSYILACWDWTTTIASKACNVDVASWGFSHWWDIPYSHGHLFHTYRKSKNIQMINAFWSWISVLF